MSSTEDAVGAGDQMVPIFEYHIEILPDWNEDRTIEPDLRDLARDIGLLNERSKQGWVVTMPLYNGRALLLQKVVGFNVIQAGIVPGQFAPAPGRGGN